MSRWSFEDDLSIALDSFGIFEIPLLLAYIGALLYGCWCPDLLVSVRFQPMTEDGAYQLRHLAFLSSLKQDRILSGTVAVNLHCLVGGHAENLFRNLGA